MKDKDFDILFIANPLTWDRESRMDIKPALNLLYLASYLNSKGLRSVILDASCENTGLDAAAEKAVSYGPRFIGAAFYQGSHDTVLKLCEKVKKLKPEIIMIGGGPLMTAVPERLLSNAAVDIGVIGEGEISLLEILKTMPDRYHKIDGIAYKKNGKVIVNPKTGYIENLDELPFLDYSLLDMKPYFCLQEKLKVPKSIFMTTSRGCAYRCTYCASPFLWPGKVRRHSVERVVDEIKYHKTNFDKINIGFLDDSFFADKKWVADFLDAVAKIDVNYSCIGRADHIDETMIKRLAETGCNFVSMGVETGSQKLQKELKKFLNLDTVRTNVAIFHKYKIYCRCFFMIGFPDETPDQMAETINFAVELKRNDMRDCTFFIVNLYAGTEMSKKFEDRLWQTIIYNDGGISDPQTARSITQKDFADEKFSRYSSVPSVDINPYIDHEILVRIVKIAYNKINAMENITVDEIMALKEK